MRSASSTLGLGNPALGDRGRLMLFLVGAWMDIVTRCTCIGDMKE